MNPTGIVTFLFTDIEGSTKLAQEFPDNIQSALEKHNSILGRVIRSFNGYVFDTAGDGFCCAFEKAQDALNAAIEVQKLISDEKWDNAEIKIRIGIHTGPAEWKENDYDGYITLARTQRVMSAAYGGQIIISNDTYSLVAEKSPSYLSFRDLGERRLRDLMHPLRLYQLISPGLKDEFPPLKTLDARPNNLPLQLTNFIGRETEMDQIKKSVMKSHIVTITGTGGTGKTRLALQIAADIIDDYDNGVWFVELASLQEPELLPQTISKTLGIQEQPFQKPVDILSGYLKNKKILIILDNCEQIIEAVSLLTEKLLSESPDLKIITTSREALRCSGELIHRTKSLKSPDPEENITPEELINFESVRLFLERATAKNPLFKIDEKNALYISDICSKLDGIPLAIELAAAKTNILTLKIISEKLNDRFKFLAGGKRTAYPRQKTLTALIDWSYDLLSENEKLLWERLSVFSGGFTLEACENICHDEKITGNDIMDLLSGLIDKSIIFFDENRQRYGMLETIRQYGEKKFKDTVEYDRFILNHLMYYKKLALSADADLYGKEIVKCLNIFDEESGNMEKALKVFSNTGKYINDLIELAGALTSYWRIRGKISEGKRRLDNILKFRNDNPNMEFTGLLFEYGIFARIQGDHNTARKFHNESLFIYREQGNKAGIADSLYNLGLLAFEEGNYKQSLDMFRESLSIYSETRNKYGIASSLNDSGNVESAQGNYEKARELYRQSLEIYREIEGKLGIAATLNNLADMALERKEYAMASEYIEESLAIRRETGQKQGIANSLHLLGTLAAEQGDFTKATEYFEESLAIRRRIGNKRGIAASLNSLGIIEFELKGSTKLFEECLSILKELDDKQNISNILSNLGDVAFMNGDFSKASDLYMESLVMRREIGQKPGIAISLTNIGRVALELDDNENALKLFGESLEISIEIKSNILIAQNLFGLGRVSLNKNEKEQAGKYFIDSLNLFRESESKMEILINLLRIIEIQLNRGYTKNGAILKGFFDQYLSLEEIKLNKNYRSDLDSLESRLLIELGEDEFKMNREKGETLTFEEAAGIMAGIMDSSYSES